jgi:hypothetical protein
MQIQPNKPSRSQDGPGKQHEAYSLSNKAEHYGPAKDKPPKRLPTQEDQHGLRRA